MHSENKVSFYTDLTKHHEFMNKLMTILSDPESSIGYCFLAPSTSDRICLFFSPLNSKYSFSNISFDFYHFFTPQGEKDEFFYNHYGEQGLSKKDIDLLHDLLKEFTFDNFHEGQFFASLFFGENFNPNKLNCIILKYVPDPNYNRYLISGRKVARFYSIVSESNLAFLLNKEDDIDYNAELIKCNTYGFTQEKEIKRCLKGIQELTFRHPSVQQLVVEHYRDYETSAGYIGKVFKFVNDELIETTTQSIKSSE